MKKSILTKLSWNKDDVYHFGLILSNKLLEIANVWGKYIISDVVFYETDIDDEDKDFGFLIFKIDISKLELEKKKKKNNLMKNTMFGQWHYKKSLFYTKNALEKMKEENTDIDLLSDTFVSLKKDDDGEFLLYQRLDEKFYIKGKYFRDLKKNLKEVIFKRSRF